MTNLRHLVLAIAMLTGPAVHAQMLSPGYGTYGAPMSNFLASSYLVQQAAQGATKATRQAQAPAAAATPPAATAAPADAPPIAPANLAKAYPQAQRQAAAAYFQQALEFYAKLERQVGLPPRDLGGAMAAFIAGNWLAYSGKPVPDAEFQALAAQMRRTLAGIDALGRAPAAERQEMYEQLAILGTHMALTHTALQQRPDAALAEKTRTAAAQYLRQFLQARPEQLVFGPDGVTSR